MRRRRHHEARATLIAGVLSLVSMACAAPPPADQAPWKSGPVDVVTAAPDAGGALSFRNCPTLDEARSAIPVIRGGPEVNAVPFKTMVLQCSYPTVAPGGQDAEPLVSILVFDASAEGPAMWDEVRSDAAFPNPVDLPGLGDRSFATGGPARFDLWVVRGAFGFHLYETTRDGISLDQMTALARVTLEGLERPPR